MTQPAASYFRYFAVGPEARHWGLALTAAGHTRVPAGAPYPPNRHPSDHDFAWERGRVLDALQIVLITAGGGWFESEATGCRTVEPGMAFVVLPKIWHRYRPNPETGWTESWLEVQGATVDNLIRVGVFFASTALQAVERAAGLEEALDRLHGRARMARPGFDPELTAAAFAALAAWEKAGRIQPTRSRMTAAILEAERLLADRISEPVNVEALARKLGVAYSHFRRAFKTHTGFAPWQYVLHLRVSQARRMLSSSDATLEAVASQLGFSSGFHLSSAFKRTYGIAPEHWRRQLANARPPPERIATPRLKRERS
jgi:AraC-like DNA-binding protein